MEKQIRQFSILRDIVLLKIRRCINVHNVQEVCSTELMVYACLDTCCSHSLTIIAGVDLYFRHESELPVCRTRGLNLGRCFARRALLGELC